MIRPLSVAGNGTVTVWHDENAHGGDVALAQLRYDKDPGGSDNLDLAALDCPVCASTSYHPIVGDDSCRAQVREMHVRLLARVGGITRLQALAAVSDRLAALGVQGS